MQLCFGQKRKTLRNNLRSIVPDDRVHQILANCNLAPDARAEQLTLAQFAPTLQNSIPGPNRLVKINKTPTSRVKKSDKAFPTLSSRLSQICPKGQVTKLAHSDTLIRDLCETN